MELGNFSFILTIYNAFYLHMKMKLQLQKQQQKLDALTPNQNILKSCILSKSSCSKNSL